MIAPGSRLTWPPSGRICRSISSFQALGGGFDVARLAGDAQRRVGERDGRLHARDAAARVARGMAQIAHLAHQAAQEAPVEAHIGILQDERGLAEPGDDAARQHVGRQASGCQEPCSAIHSSTSARALARVMPDSAARRWRSQPKPKQRRRPVVGRRLHFENRAAVADHDFAGESEAAGIDFARARGVRGAQILRRDQEPVGLERQHDRPAQERMTVDAAGEPPHGAANEEPGQLRMVRDGNARHRPRSPLLKHDPEKSADRLRRGMLNRASRERHRARDHNETMTERPTAA